MEQREKPAKDVAKKINEEDLKDKSKEELLTIISDLRKENLSNAIISWYPLRPRPENWDNRKHVKQEGRTSI